MSPLFKAEGQNDSNPLSDETGHSTSLIWTGCTVEAGSSVLAW